jgi:hypothetical protein
VCFAITANALNYDVFTPDRDNFRDSVGMLRFSVLPARDVTAILPTKVATQDTNECRKRT